MDDLLSAIFYRRSCPEPEMLGDYHLGRLAPGNRLAVALHLRECPHCTAELALYATLPQDEADRIPDGLLDAARDALKGLIGRVLWATPAPDALPAPILRGAVGPQRVYRADDTRVVLEVQPATSGYRRKRLLGKVEPPGAAIGAELWHESELLGNLAVGQDGHFSFDRLAPGAYILCLRGGATEVWLDVNVAAPAP